MGITIVDLEKTEDETYGEDFEAFQRLSFDEQFDYIISWMKETQKAILELVRKVELWQDSIDEQKKMVETVSKAVNIARGKRTIIKNILKGAVTSTHGIFKKESDVLKRYVKDLEEMTYIV